MSGTEPGDLGNAAASRERKGVRHLMPHGWALTYNQASGETVPFPVRLNRAFPRARRPGNALPRGHVGVYTLIARGSRVTSQIEDGDLVMIDPDREPQPRNIVEVSVGDGTELVRLEEAHKRGLPINGTVVCCMKDWASLLEEAPD